MGNRGRWGRCGASDRDHLRRALERHQRRSGRFADHGSGASACRAAARRNTQQVGSAEEDRGCRAGRAHPQLFKPDDQEIIERIYNDWEEYRNAQGTGKLDIAFARKDYSLLREALKGINKMNREFTILAARRYSEMLADDDG